MATDSKLQDCLISHNNGSAELNLSSDSASAATASAPMRLAYLCFQATREGQASHAHVHEIISGLRARGQEVTLFEPCYADGQYRAPGAVGRMFEFLRMQATLATRLHKFDVLYVRSHFVALPIAWWARLLRVPVVQEVNGPYEDLFQAWPWTRRFAALFTWMARKQLQWADALITVTPQLDHWLRADTGNDRIYVVPNAANSRLFNPDARSMAELPYPYVIFFGALAPWQGIDVLLQAARHPKWPHQVKLVIVGDGTERPRVEEAARNHQLIYLGPVSYKNMPGLIAGALAGISAKPNLGDRVKTGLSPLKVFETMACGVPAIVSDIPGTADLVREASAGMIVKAGDAGALADAVASLFADPEGRQQMGKRGREAVLREHSWDARSAETLSILAKVRPQGIHA